MSTPLVLIAGGPLGWQAATAAALGRPCRVRTVGRPGEAVQHVLAAAPDLLILDDGLARADGGRLPQLIRAYVPRMPVIVHTSSPAGPLAAVGELAVCGLCSSPAVREVLALVAAALDLEPPAGGSGAQHVSAALAFVARHPGRKLRVGDVAAAIGLSTAHFAKVFRNDTRMPAKDYLAGVHLEIAKRLLYDTDAKLEVVAERAGFCDSSHLVRSFQRHLGCTPGAFRRDARVVPVRVAAGAS